MARIKKIISLFNNKKTRPLLYASAGLLICIFIWCVWPTRFDRAVRFTLHWEGELSDLENDRGGITKYGITAPFLADYRKVLTDPKPETVADVTRSQAIEMYHALWRHEKLDSIACEAIACAIFDYTVHSSARDVIQRLQHLLNSRFAHSLPEDGLMGSQTIAIINALDPQTLFNTIQDERRTYLKTFIADNPSQQPFEKGWMNRIDALKFN